jgi:hypothetical protein
VLKDLVVAVGRSDESKNVAGRHDGIIAPGLDFAWVLEEQVAKCRLFAIRPDVPALRAPGHDSCEREP